MSFRERNRGQLGSVKKKQKQKQTNKQKNKQNTNKKKLVNSGFKITFHSNVLPLKYFAERRTKQNNAIPRWCVIGQRDLSQIRGAPL